MGAGDLAHFIRALDPGKGGEVPDVEAVGAQGVGVGEPLQLGRLSESPPEFGAAQVPVRKAKNRMMGPPVHCFAAASWFTVMPLCTIGMLRPCGRPASARGRDG